MLGLNAIDVDANPSDTGIIYLNSLFRMRLGPYK